MDKDKRTYRKELRGRCRRVLGHGAETPAEILGRVAAWCADNAVEFDHYGTGSLIETFEAKVAALLGFPAARFMPSGKVAQNVALRVWSERAGNSHFGMHPTSHLELHEARAYEHLFGLRTTLVGPHSSPLLAEHLQAVPEALSALLIELPIREAGGQLPTWEELEELKAAARERGTRLHLDGARLWETAAWYGRTYREICAGFDSVYVSFYKGIGALSGAMLLGEKDFIEEAAVWQKRCGGELYTLAPNVASAAMLFDERVARMPAYFERTVELAEAVNAIDGITTLPREPQTNMMHVCLPCDAEAACEARDQIAEESGVWLLDGVRDADRPGEARYEWYVGEAACALEVAEIAQLFRRFRELVGSTDRVPSQSGPA